MPDTKVVTKQFGALKALPDGFTRPEDGDWVIMTAEVPPEDERGGDIIRVKGMKVSGEVPLQAQHLRHAPDGSPTTIGKVVETRDTVIKWGKESVPAKLGRFVWAPTELAAKYKALWPEFLNSVSIGALIKTAEPLDKKNPFGGYDYTETELYECSIVTVGANPAAKRVIQQALGIHSDDAIDLIASADDADDVVDDSADIERLYDAFTGLDKGLADLTKESEAKNAVLAKALTDLAADITTRHTELAKAFADLADIAKGMSARMDEMHETVKETHAKVHEMHGEVCGGTKKNFTNRFDDLEDFLHSHVTRSDAAGASANRKAQQKEEDEALKAALAVLTNRLKSHP